MCSLPSWAQPKALLNFGNTSNDDISRERLVIVHSKGKEARKLEGFAEFRGSVDVGDRILQGFTFAEQYDSLRLLIYMAPIQILKVFKILENMYLQRTIRSQKCKLIIVRNASQERESGMRVRNASQEPALTGWLLLSRRSGF